MNYKINDLFDIDKLKRLVESYAQLTDTPTSILDLEGNVLVGSQWQDICRNYHRSHPETAKHCLESDTVLANQLIKGGQFNIYKCKNGLVDVAVPIYVEEIHIGTLFTGQFLLDPPDIDFFRNQAKKYGFDESAYLEAVNKVPIKTKDQVVKITNFFCRLSEMIGEMGLARLELNRREAALRKNEKNFRRFEWLLEKEGDFSGSRNDDYVPPYPDVTKLNTRRVILDAVGGELLRRMASDLMDLLETSVGVYEANGDSAFGLFASGWCQMADAASFALCGAGETKAALASGKWLCHECCWNESAKAAIKSGEPTDIECVGGIRLYAVPIRASKEIVGAINIGYGTPPQDDARLRESADRFGLSLEDVRRMAMQYKPRPQYIIDVAKGRCRSVAHHIGEIIERSAADKAVRASHDRLEVAVAGGGLGTWEWVIPTGETVLNDQWQTMLGFEPGEVGMRLECAHELTDPEALPSLHKLMRAHLDGDTPYYEAVYRMRHKSGEWVWIHDRGQVIDRSGDGSPLRVCGTHADVTPLMQAEEELRKSEKNFRLLFDNASIGIATVDRHGNFITTNPAYEKMLGYSKEELKGMSFFDVTHPDYRPKNKKLWLMSRFGVF